MDEILSIVNENDGVIGKAGRKDVLIKKLLHRSVSVVVKNLRGEILVTKRSANVDSFPNMIDARVAGRVKAGETYDETAIRELSEEVRIENPKIKFLFKKLFPEYHAFRSIYECIYGGKLRLQKEEAAWAKFLPISELKEMMAKKDFSPSSRAVLEEYFKHET